jgi:hypothetical protein
MVLTGWFVLTVRYPVVELGGCTRVAEYQAEWVGFHPRFAAAVHRFSVVVPHKVRRQWQQAAEQGGPGRLQHGRDPPAYHTPHRGSGAGDGRVMRADPHKPTRIIHIIRG